MYNYHENRSSRSSRESRFGADAKAAAPAAPIVIAPPASPAAEPAAPVTSARNKIQFGKLVAGAVLFAGLGFGLRTMMDRKSKKR